MSSKFESSVCRSRKIIDIRRLCMCVSLFRDSLADKTKYRGEAAGLRFPKPISLLFESLLYIFRSPRDLRREPHRKNVSLRFFLHDSQIK